MTTAVAERESTGPSVSAIPSFPIGAWTVAYNRLKVAMFRVSKRHRPLRETDVRVLMTIYARGEQASHHDVRDDWRREGTAVRRSSVVLREYGAITVAGIDGGETRKGVVTMMRLTPLGMRICAEVTEEVRSHA